MRGNNKERLALVYFVKIRTCYRLYGDEVTKNYPEIQWVSFQISNWSEEDKRGPCSAFRDLLVIPPPEIIGGSKEISRRSQRDRPEVNILRILSSFSKFSLFLWSLIGPNLIIWDKILKRLKICTFKFKFPAVLRMDTRMKQLIFWSVKLNVKVNSLKLCTPLGYRRCRRKTVTWIRAHHSIFRIRFEFDGQ